MKRPARDEPSETLFDLPLDQEVGEAAEQAPLPLEPAAAANDTEPRTARDGGFAGDGGSDRPTPAQAAGLRRRLEGGLLDGAAHAAVLLMAMVGSWWLGVPPSRLTVLPLLLFAAGFSFVYHVLPLVFWGCTPGMAQRGLVARSLDGGPLTIGQAVRRWLGAIASFLSLGLVLAFGAEETISDRLSASRVYLSS